MISAILLSIVIRLTKVNVAQPALFFYMLKRLVWNSGRERTNPCVCSIRFSVKVEFFIIITNKGNGKDFHQSAFN